MPLSIRCHFKKERVLLIQSIVDSDTDAEAVHLKLCNMFNYMKNATIVDCKSDHNNRVQKLYLENSMKVCKFYSSVLF